MKGNILDGFVIVKQKRPRLVVFLPIAILYAFMGFELMTIGNGRYEESGNKSDYIFAILGFSVAVFFAFDACCLVRDILFPRVVFAYNDDGFYIKNLKSFVRWGDVETAEIIRISSKTNRKFRRKAIALKLHNGSKFFHSLPLFGKLTYILNLIFHMYGIVINFKATGVDPEYIWWAFKERCKYALEEI